MIRWLFKDYNESAYGIFRISFYLTFFCFYHKTGTLHYDGWLTPEFKSFFDPISFFKLFQFEDLVFFKNFNGIFYWKMALICSALGFLFPISSFLSFLGMLIFAGIPLNFGKIHHLNHLPVVVMGIMALSFFPGSFSIDNFLCKKLKLSPVNPSKWALQASRLYMTLIYCASGAQKLKNTGLSWIFSDNMQVIIISRPTVTKLGLLIAEYPLLCQGMALVTVLAQLFAPLALFFPRLRYVIIPVLFFLHIGTYLVLGNHGYFFPYNLCFVVWLPWEKITAQIRQLLNKLRPKTL